MATANLMLHAGSREVDYRDLPDTAPPATRTWFPIAHKRIVDACLGTLDAAGYKVNRMRLGLSPDGHRLFGVLDLATQLVDAVALSCGLRNSTNKSFPLGFCAGSGVLVCDNLQFRSELLVNRKHTRHGERRFNNAICAAVQSLSSFKVQEAARITSMRGTPVTEETAAHYLLRSMEESIVSAQRLPDIWQAWKQPQHDYGPPTLWRLLNSFTEVLAPRAITAPNEYAGQTIRLNRLLTPEEGTPPSPANSTSIAG